MAARHLRLAQTIPFSVNIPANFYADVSHRAPNYAGDIYKILEGLYTEGGPSMGTPVGDGSTRRITENNAYLDISVDTRSRTIRVVDFGEIPMPMTQEVSAPYTLLHSQAAERDITKLLRIPRNKGAGAEYLLSSINALSVDPFPHNSEKVQASSTGQRRLKLDKHDFNFRVLYHVVAKGHTVQIDAVAERDEGTYRKVSNAYCFNGHTFELNIEKE